MPATSPGERLPALPKVEVVTSPQSRPADPGGVDPGRSATTPPGRDRSDPLDPGDRRDPGYVDLGYARLDTQRLARTGDPEVVYGAGKTGAQTLELLQTLRAAHPDRPAIATRLTPETIATVVSAHPDALVDDEAGAVALGEPPAPVGRVCVVSAGTSDASVAAEAAFTARIFGAGVHRIADVGVAGIHRLLAVKDELDAADCLVVVAGMEGALPSVVGGLTGVPLVAVPTSVGYGASFGGLAALLAMLNSCAPGVTVVNIDNGFGAGVFAARVARRPALDARRDDRDDRDAPRRNGEAPR